MSVYIVSPTDITTPTNSQGAKQGAEELRALKAYIATLTGLPALNNPFINPPDNLIHGGDFSTNPWQRGTNFAAVVDGAYTADRWQYNKVGAQVDTVAQSAASLPTVAIAGRYTSQTLIISTTTINAAPAVGEFARFTQKIEGYNTLGLIGNTCVLQFLSAHHRIGIYCVAFYDAGNNRTYVAEYTQAVADVWQLNTIIVPPAAAILAPNVTSGIGWEVRFCRMTGATFQTPPNIWTAGTFYGTANQVNSVGSLTDVFRIADIDLHPGAVAMPLRARTVEEELDKCLRYCEVWGGDNVNQVFVDGLPLNPLTMQGIYKFKKQMRVPPGLTLSALGDFTLSNVAGTAVPSAISTSTPGRLNTAIFGTSAGAWTAVNQQVFIFGNSINSRAIFSADL